MHILGFIYIYMHIVTTYTPMHIHLRRYMYPYANTHTHQVLHASSRWLVGLNNTHIQTYSHAHTNTHQGVTCIGKVDFPSQLAGQSSQLYSNNISSLMMVRLICFLVF